MSLEIVIGGAACGKTTEVLNRVRSELSTSELKRIWVILPDRRKINAFREKLLYSSGMLGVSIGLFYEFGNELLLISDQNQTEAPDLLLHRILLDIILKHSQSGELGEFEAIKTKPGFIQLIHQKIKELTQAGYSNGYDHQVEVILKLYYAYQRRLAQLRWMDSHQIVSVALAALRSNPSLLSGLDLVVADGFERFTPPQRDLLCFLAESGIRVMVTLSGNDSAGRMIYQRAQVTLEEFRSTYPKLEIHYTTAQPFLPAGILGLVNNLMVDHPQKIEKQADVRLLAAYSPLQEVREALRYIKFLQRERALTASDCAILVPDEVQYSPLILTVAEEYGIPVHFAWGMELKHVAALALILELVRVWREDFPRRRFLDLIRSPFVDLTSFGFKAEDAAILERVSRFGPVIAGFENWIKVLQRIENVEKEELEEEEEEDIFHLPNAETCRRLIGNFYILKETLEPPSGEKQIKFWVEWLWKLLISIGWFSRLSSTTKSPWLEKFKQILKEMCIVDRELGIWLLDFEGFVAELETSLQLNTYQTAEEKNQVPVLRIRDASGSRFEHVVIVGLAEGVFPKIQREDPFFPETFRQAAGLESQTDQNQLGVFYQAITRANTSLMISRPYMSEKGDALEPSPYWNAMETCLPEEDVEFIRSTTRRDLNEAASLEEMFFWSQLQKIPIIGKDEHISYTIRRLDHQKQVLFSRQVKKASGVYEGELESLPPGLERFQKIETDWSASRLETYTSCPLRFWTQYGLGVVEQRIPELGLQSFQIGSVLHQILEEVYKAAKDPTNVDELLAILPETAREIFAVAPEKYQFEPTVYWQTLQTEWLVFLEAAISGLASDHWHPLVFEAKFGLEGQPALRIRLENGRIVRLHGVIDRIDRDDQGNLRVIDYKTGASHLGKDDLMKGTRLQLPLYALAASQALNLGEVSEGFYWTLRGKKESSLKLSDFQEPGFEGPEGAFQVARLHLEFIISGLIQADFRPQVPEGGCPKYCSARLWCWRYRPGR